MQNFKDDQVVSKRTRGPDEGDRAAGVTPFRGTRCERRGNAAVGKCRQDALPAASGAFYAADLPTVQTSSKLRFHRGSMDPILRLRIPVLTVSRVNGSDFTHLGTSLHRKLFNCFLKTVKTGTQMCKI
jgi:hypothetical protein